MLLPATRAAETVSSPQQDAWEIYKATQRRAWDEYKAVVKQAWDHYRAEDKKAWDRYRTGAKQAWDVYSAVAAKAWKDYGFSVAYYAKKNQAKQTYYTQKKEAKQAYYAKKEQEKEEYHRKKGEAKEAYNLTQKQAQQAYYRSVQKGAPQPGTAKQGKAAIDPLQPRNSTEEVVKQILVQLAPGGSEVYGLAEIVTEALDSGPVFLAEYWNKKFVLADAMSAPLIEPTWAQSNKAKMIALDIALKHLQRQLEGNNKNVSPENFPKYQELIDRVRGI